MTHRAATAVDSSAAMIGRPTAGGGGGVSEYTLSRYVFATTDKPLATIDGWPINLADLESAVDAIVRAAEARDSFSVFTLNLDHLSKLHSNSRFRSAYARARFVTADGEPVARLAARQDRRIQRTTGADLVVPLVKAAARAELPVYLFGTSPDVLADAGAYLSAATNGTLDIVGSASPPQGFAPESGEADHYLDRIAASGARLCLVALGAPKQELLAARAVERGIEVGFVCIGAALDFLAGSQLRAPPAMQKAGLEWLWRLVTNPRRLAVRYALSALVLADITVLSPIRQALTGARS